MTRLTRNRALFATLQAEGPTTPAIIASARGVTERHTIKMLYQLARDGAAHISHYTDEAEPVWVAGEGTHAPRPRQSRHLATLLQARGNMTCRQIAEATGFTAQHICEMLNELEKTGAAHIAEYVGPTRSTPIWAHGPGKSARRPKIMAAILKLLEQGPRSNHSLANALGANLATVHRATETMRAMKILHVCGWAREGYAHGAPRVILAIGNEPDAPRPCRKTAADCCKDWRKKAKRTPAQLSLAGLLGVPAKRQPKQRKGARA